MVITTNMVMPKIEREAVARNYGKFVISPLEAGYGITVGNALRRVLLSSLDGAAVTSIRITDVPHEFSDIPSVREDVLQLMLNIKKLRLLIHDTDSARLRCPPARPEESDPPGPAGRRPPRKGLV